MNDMFPTTGPDNGDGQPPPAWPPSEQFEPVPNLLPSPMTPTALELTLRVTAILEFADACRDLLAFAETYIADQDNKTPAEVAIQNLPKGDVSREVKSNTEKIFAELERKIIDSVGQAESQDFTDEQWSIDAVAAALQVFKIEDLAGPFINQLLSETASQAEMIPYLLAYGSAIVRRSRKTVLFRGLLSTICSDFEAGVARLLRRDRFTAGNYSSFDSADLTADVRKLMVGGLPSWREKLESTINVDISTIILHWEEFAEIFERRHVFIHRSGAVDSDYQKKVHNAPPVGSQLELTPEYLRRSIDLCEILSIGVTTLALAHYTPDTRGQLARLVLFLSEGAAARKQFDLANGFHRIAGILATDRLDVERSRVNIWLEQVAANGPESIRTEVLGWDTTELPPEFALARLILLENDDEALPMFTSLRAQGVITSLDVSQWRLFQRWREHGHLQ